MIVISNIQAVFVSYIHTYYACRFAHLINCCTHFAFFKKNNSWGSLQTSQPKDSNTLTPSQVEAYLRRAAWWVRRSGPSWWCGKHDRGCWSDGMCRSQGPSSHPQVEREPAEPVTHRPGLMTKKQAKKKVITVIFKTWRSLSKQVKS